MLRTPIQTNTELILVPTEKEKKLPGSICIPYVKAISESPNI
jgi:hypothetical protein